MAVIVRLVGHTFSDTTLPKLQGSPRSSVVVPGQSVTDSLVNTGSIFLFDFANTASLSVTASTGNGTVLTNQVSGKPNATIVGSGITRQTKSLRLSGQSGSYINLGDVNIATMPAPSTSRSGSPDFLVICWFRQNADRVLGEWLYTGLIGRINSTNSSSAQFGIDFGNDGITPRAYVYGSNGADSTHFGQGTNGEGEIIQIGMSVVNGKTLLYKNGSVVSGDPGSINLPYSNPEGIETRIGGFFSNFRGDIFRAYMENLTVSGKAALAQIQADYAANKTKFS